MTSTFVVPSYSARYQLDKKFNHKKKDFELFQSLSNKVISFAVPLALTPSVLAENNIPANDFNPISWPKFSFPSKIEIYNTGKQMIKDALYEIFVEPVVNFIINLWDFIVSSSPIVGACIAIISVPFYLAGYKKAKKIAIGSFVVVFLIITLDILFHSL